MTIDHFTAPSESVSRAPLHTKYSLTQSPPSSPTERKPKYLSSSTDLGIIACAFSGGQHRPGVDIGPTEIIDSGLLTSLQDDLSYNLHWDETVHTYPTLIPAHDPRVDNMLTPLAVSAVTHALSHQVYHHASHGRLTLTLGGDHSIAMGSVFGAAKAVYERTGKKLGLIWVDAHADINTPATSGSGNIHGMPVAFLCGIAKHPLFSWMQDQKVGKEGILDTTRVVYIGLRDVDKGEKRILKEQGIKAFSMHDVDKYGIGQVTEMAIEHLRDEEGDTGPIYLSFDVDAVDPAFAPSTGTPVRGGLTLREGDFICEAVHETGNLVGMDLVEVNPLLGLDESKNRPPPATITADMTPSEIREEQARAARKLAKHERKIKELKEDLVSQTVGTACSLIRCALGESLLEK